MASLDNLETLEIYWGHMNGVFAEQVVAGKLTRHKMPAKV
jgi:hypothetical protein